MKGYRKKETLRNESLFLSGRIVAKIIYPGGRGEAQSKGGFDPNLPMKAHPQQSLGRGKKKLHVKRHYLYLAGP